MKVQVITSPQLTIPPLISIMPANKLELPDFVRESFVGLVLESETDTSPYVFLWSHVKTKLFEAGHEKTICYFEDKLHFSDTSKLQISSLFCQKVSSEKPQ